MKVVTEVRAGQIHGFFQFLWLLMAAFPIQTLCWNCCSPNRDMEAFLFGDARGNTGKKKKRKKMFILGVPQTSRDPAKGGLQGICKAADLALPGSR